MHNLDERRQVTAELDLAIAAVLQEEIRGAVVVDVGFLDHVILQIVLESGVADRTASEVVVLSEYDLCNLWRIELVGKLLAALNGALVRRVKRLVLRSVGKRGRWHADSQQNCEGLSFDVLQVSLVKLDYVSNFGLEFDHEFVKIDSLEFELVFSEKLCHEFFDDLSGPRLTLLDAEFQFLGLFC